MRSASAEHFRRASREATLRMTAEERLVRPHALAECLLSVYAAANGLSLEEARAAQRARTDAARRAAANLHRHVSDAGAPPDGVRGPRRAADAIVEAVQREIGRLPPEAREAWRRLVDLAGPGLDF